MYRSIRPNTCIRFTSGVDHKDTAQGQGKNCSWPKGAPPNRKVWRNGVKQETYCLLLQGKKRNQYQIVTDYNHWRNLNDSDTIKARKTGNKLELIDKLEKN